MKAEEVMLLASKVGFGAKQITRDKKEHSIMIKHLPYQEDIIIPAVYEPNNRASKYMEIELKEERHAHSYSWILQHRSLSKRINRSSVRL